VATPLRQVRERELVAATRALFDERGMQHAPVEEIAKAVGIARGLIYRHFSSKEELYVLTVTDYLAELEGELAAATGDGGDPVACTTRLLEAYASFCRRFPAFLDCSMSLMQRPARGLRETVSDAVWLRLGQAMAPCLEHVAATLRSGTEAGVFSVEDPDLMANLLWTQVLGAMHLARLGVGVRQAAPGVPDLFAVDDDDVVRACVRSALATIGAPPPA
jgi:AcrR family transcriptional regulator